MKLYRYLFIHGLIWPSADLCYLKGPPPYDDEDDFIYSIWVETFSVRKKNISKFLQDTRSRVANECFCPHIADISNVNFINRIIHALIWVISVTLRRFHL